MNRFKRLLSSQRRLGSRSFIMTFVILFSFSCFADNTVNENSELITFRQQITYVFSARAGLLAKGIITRGSVIDVQAQAVWHYLHHECNESSFSGDKRALSADRVGAMIETFIQIEAFDPLSSHYVLETAVDIHFIGEVAQIMLPRVLKNQGVKISAEFIYNALAVQHIVPPHEPEFNLAKIESFLTGQDQLFDGALAELVSFFEVRKNAFSILSLEKKVSLVLDILERFFSNQITLEHIPALAENIELYITDEHGVYVSSNIILLILEARYLVGRRATTEQVVRGLEVNFARETQSEREALGNPTTAADVKARAVGMHIIEQGITPEFDESRIAHILSQVSGHNPAEIMRAGSQRAAQNTGVAYEQCRADMEREEALADQAREEDRENKYMRKRERRFKEEIRGRSGRSKR